MIGAHPPSCCPPLAHRSWPDAAMHTCASHTPSTVHISAAKPTWWPMKFHTVAGRRRRDVCVPGAPELALLKPSARIIVLR
jgi:hypothetical protein